MHASVIKTLKSDNPAITAESVAIWASEQIAPLISDNRSDQVIGIYLATGDIGAKISITFWADALESGLAFANPAAFPGTLASSCATKIAEKLCITGPNYTLVGGGEASQQIIQHAMYDINGQQVDSALIIGIDITPYPALGFMMLGRDEGVGLLTSDKIRPCTAQTLASIAVWTLIDQLSE